MKFRIQRKRVRRPSRAVVEATWYSDFGDADDSSGRTSDGSGIRDLEADFSSALTPTRLTHSGASFDTLISNVSNTMVLDRHDALAASPTKRAFGYIGIGLLIGAAIVLVGINVLL